MNNELLDKLEDRQAKQALVLLKALEKRIKKGQLKVMESGFWEGGNGKWNFHFVAREADDFRPFTEL